MAGTMSGEGFLGRWSRLKNETRQGRRGRAAPVEIAVAAKDEAKVEMPALSVMAISEQQAGLTPKQPSEETVAPMALSAEAVEDYPEDLPDIESLDSSSDYTAFLKDKVPERLRKMALQKLWRSDPVFANLDGLNDYDEDFNNFIPLAKEVAEEIKSLMERNRREVLGLDEVTPTKGSDPHVGVLPEDQSVQIQHSKESPDQAKEKEIIEEKREIEVSPTEGEREKSLNSVA